MVRTWAALRWTIACALALLLARAQAQPRPLFEAHSAGMGGGKMDISVIETERRPRTSVLDIRIRQMRPARGPMKATG